MALDLKHQREINKLLKENESIQSRIDKGVNVRGKTLEKQEENQKKINDLLTKHSTEYASLGKTIANAAKNSKQLVASGKDQFGFSQSISKQVVKTLENTKGLLELNKVDSDLAEKMNEIGENLVKQNYDLSGLAADRLDLNEALAAAQKEGNQDLEDNIKGMLKGLDAEKRRLKINQRINGAVKGADDMFGGMGSKIKGFLTNPLTAALALLLTFNATQEAIADQFGAVGVTKFRDELAEAGQNFTKLGYEQKEAFKVTSTLSNEFGIAFSRADDLSESVARTARAAGMSVDETASLVGLLVKTQGLSGQQAEDLLLSARQLAVANDVAPDKVLQDVAKNTELFAKFSKDGGKNILEAAVQARKLGINLDSVAKTADGMLNFQESLNNEIEASIMLGRNLNLQKARELAFNNDLKGLQQEIVNLVGTEADFNEMNAFERKSLAKALNMEVSDIQKIVSGQKEQKTLQGEITRLTSENELPEEAITKTAETLFMLKQTGLELAESIGPAVNMFATGINMVAKGLEHTVGLGPALLGLFAGMKMYTTAIALKEKQTLAARVLSYAVANPIKAAIGAAVGAGLVGMALQKVGSAQEGAFTNSDGLVNAHAAELITPIDKLADFLADAMQPVVEAVNKNTAHTQVVADKVGNVGKDTVENMLTVA